jgi:hypothetical protein
LLYFARQAFIKQYKNKDNIHLFDFYRKLHLFYRGLNMLTKNMTIAQVSFGSMPEWQADYKAAIGEFLIACSQWEYVYELLWKDLNPTTDPFEDRLREADKQIRFGGVNLKLALTAEGSQECLHMRKIIEQLESSYRGQRDIMVHGFHHIYGGNALVSRFANRQADVIGDELIPEILSKDAVSINTMVNNLNGIRRQKFHICQSAVGVSAAV